MLIFDTHPYVGKLVTSLTGPMLITDVDPFVELTLYEDNSDDLPDHQRWFRVFFLKGCGPHAGKIDSHEMNLQDLKEWVAEWDWEAA